MSERADSKAGAAGAPRPRGRALRGFSAATLMLLGSAVILAVASCGSKTAAETPQVPPPTVAEQTVKPVHGSAKRVLMAVGDIACPAAEPVTADSCRQAAVAKRIAKIDPAAVLLLGDIQYNFGEYEQFKSSFAKSWAALRDQWRPSSGNHEYYNEPPAAGYFKFFGRRAGKADRGYYSFDVAGWHVVSLNSNCAYVSCAANSAQARWLRADLAASDAKCTIAYWHHPLFSSGEHGNNRLVRHLWAALAAAHADLVLSGHDHDYERFAPQDATGRLDAANGMREFVVGTGGRSHYPLQQRRPHSQYFSAKDFGALELKLGRSSYRWRFVTTAGRSFDRGAGRCH